MVEFTSASTSCRCLIRGNGVNSRTPWGSLGSFSRPSCLWVHPGSLGSITRALGSLGTTWVFELARVGTWVDQGSFGSLPCALGVVEFIRCIWVHLRVHWRSLDSYWGVEFADTRPVVHLGTFGSVACTLVLVGFIRALLCSLGLCGFGRFTRSLFGVIVFIQHGCVHSRAPLGDFLFVCGGLVHSHQP